MITLLGNGFIDTDRKQSWCLQEKHFETESGWSCYMFLLMNALPESDNFLMTVCQMCV